MTLKSMIRRLYGATAVSLLLWGCSATEEGIPSGDSSSCRVGFRLGGAAGGASSRIATKEGETVSDGELQTNWEKQVNSLLAVVFKDTDPSGDTEDNTADTYFRTVEVDLGGKTDPVIEDLSFLVGDEGNYQVIFVANADENLTGKINALEKDVSTVQTLKDLEVSQSPDTKPGMLMTSGFIGFHASLTTPANLGIVYLHRIMSRIDLVNMAEGITVTRAVLHNRTVKSWLYNDDRLTVETGYIGAEKTYADLNLAGSKEAPGKYEAEIYTYEQLADKTQLDHAPSLDVYYTVAGTEPDGTDGKEYKHTVTLLVLSKDEPTKLVPLGLKRNNAYQIRLRRDAGDVTYEIVVADWVQGEVFQVTDGELADEALGEEWIPGGVDTNGWETEGDATTVPAEDAL